MNMGCHGPSGLPEQGHEPACRFLGVATALGLHAHHPGNLSGTSSRAAAGIVTCTVPTALPVSRTRITQLPHS